MELRISSRALFVCAAVTAGPGRWLCVFHTDWLCQSAGDKLPALAMQEFVPMIVNVWFVVN